LFKQSTESDVFISDGPSPTDISIGAEKSSTTALFNSLGGSHLLFEDTSTGVDNPPLSVPPNDAKLFGSLADLYLLSEDNHFDQWSARQRLAHIRRILLAMESKWGTIDRWGLEFMIDWNRIKVKGVDEVMGWFDQMMQRICLGRRVLGCLGRVMEGEMPIDVEEWRDLWVQAYQLTSIFNTGFLSLQHRLDLAVAQQLK
jgi:hypothetical protein